MCGYSRGRRGGPAKALGRVSGAWVQIPDRTPYGGVAKWLNAGDCKSSPPGFGSSNLSPSTICSLTQVVEGTGLENREVGNGAKVRIL